MTMLTSEISSGVHEFVHRQYPEQMQPLEMHGKPNEMGVPSQKTVKMFLIYIYMLPLLGQKCISLMFITDNIELWQEQRWGFLWGKLIPNEQGSAPHQSNYVYGSMRYTVSGWNIYWVPICTEQQEDGGGDRPFNLNQLLQWVHFLLAGFFFQAAEFRNLNSENCLVWTLHTWLTDRVSQGMQWQARQA